MKNKTLKELKDLGVDVMFFDRVMQFQEDNYLTKLEMVLLLQKVKCFILDNIVLDTREGK